MLKAVSISRRVAELLQPGPAAGRVLASFSRACDLLTDEGALIALVWAGGGGPLNVVLAEACAPAVGTRFTVAHGELRFGGLAAPAIALAPATLWEPRPDWEALRAARPRITGRARRLSERFGRRDATLPDFLAGELAAAGVSLADAYRMGDGAGLAVAAGRLCGLGPGLTPAGDDWLAGWLLACWLNDGTCNPAPTGRQNGTGLTSGPAMALPGAHRAGDVILAVAAERTTLLSRAFLACAAAGEADEAWHRLLWALAAAPSPEADARLSVASGSVCAHGATSGTAMLLGFLAGITAAVKP